MMRIFLNQIKLSLVVLLALELAMVFHFPTESYSMYVGPDCNESILVSLPHVGSKVLFLSNVGSKDVDDFSLFSVNSDGSGGLTKISEVSYRNPILLSSDEKKVAFTTLVDTTDQIFVADIDGKNMRQLTFDDMPKSAIAIFPDGSRVIYGAHPFNDIGAVDNFFSIKSDGTNQVQLTNDSSDKGWPVVSADGTTLVFNDLSNETSKILAVNTDGSNLHYITEGSLFSHLPVLVSANGSKIVFSRDDPNDSNIKYLYTINVDGTDLIKLVPNAIYSQSDFTISLDGSKVAFDDSNTKENHVAVVNSDSTGYIRLYDTLSYASYPSLSHNGSKLMFTSLGFEKSTLYIIDAKKPSVPVKIAETMPSWLSMLSEDGTKLVFSNYTNGTMQAYVTNLPGKNPIPLIDNSYFKPNPDCKIPSDKIEYIGDPNISPEQQEDYQRFIMISAIGIPSLAVTIGFVIWYKFSVRKFKG